MKKLLYTMLSILLLLTACKKDIDDTTITDVPDPNNDKVNGLVFLVQDINKKPIADATVLIDGKNFKTNAQGEVSINDVLIGANGAAASAEKTGYFKGFQRVFKDDKKATVTMLQKKDCITIDNTKPFKSPNTLPLDAFFEIPADIFMLPNGTSYSGSVDICYARVKKDTSFYSDLVTSNFSVALSTGKPYRTSPFGAFFIEATTPNGTLLQLKQGKEIKVTLGFFDPFYELYPASVPSLFLDSDNANTWTEYKTMKKINSIQYQFDINRVNTIWTSNSDIDIVTLTGKIVDTDNTPLTDYQIYCINDKTGKGTYAKTDKDGVFGVFAIANETSTLRIACDNNDNTILQSTPVAAYSKNAMIPNVTVKNMTVVKGKVVDCNNNPVKSGTVSYALGEYFTIQNDGTFAIPLSCKDFVGNKITLDINAQGDILKGQVFDFKSNEITNVGTINLCNLTGSTQILINYNGKDYYHNEQINFDEDAGNILFSADKIDGNGYRIASISIDKPIVLNTPTKLLSILFTGQLVAAGSFKEIIDCNNCMTLTITKYTPNTEIKGTFSGNAIDGKPITGSFYYKK